MSTYLVNLWDSLRTSFWFVPVVLGTLAVIASFAFPAFDARLADEHLGWIATTTPAARSTLSAIAGAMVAVAGTVFSITIVTLSLTSQQFGPRLLRTFMVDFPTQFTIGTFLSTGLYCLLVLRAVEGQEPGATPDLSVAVAVGLTVFSMGLLIYFIHHVAVMIQAPHVVGAVANDLDDAILRLFPQTIGQPPGEDERRQAAAIEQEQQLDADFRAIRSRCEGYIQAIDAHRLMQLAEKKSLVIRLRKRPGHYVSQGTLVADVWPTDDQETEDIAGRLNECIIVGARRTPRQDVECAIEELVEVAVRSLSPGINDPFTAINCIDRLGSTLGRLANRRIPASHRCNRDGRLRVIAPVVTFPDVADAAFNQIRQYGSDSPAVAIRLLETFLSLMERSSRRVDRDAIVRHADLVLNAAKRSFPEDEDLQAIRERHSSVLSAAGSDT